jgi:hypothetical protein
MWLARASAIAPLLLLASVAICADGDPPKNATIGELYKSGALFDSKQYPAVRAAFSKAFAERHAVEIQRAFSTDLLAWLEKHPAVRDDLYTAIDERFDNVRAALEVFASLWKEYPSKLEEYPALAIATAVVWDNPAAVYDYTQHQVRTKSKLPSPFADGKANFEYLTSADKSITSNLKALPREFLTFVVDNKTPVNERGWAQKFVATQKGTASWHQSVEYDKGMLRTEQTGSGPGPKLAGHDYTLANIKKYGGVCAQQADFVARVGKSLGQPSMYVWGESAYRGLHAWVMWVTPLKTAAGKDGVRFALVSDGRTRGFEKDAFYVGFLTDPHTGQKMTDRDMERRLSVVALGTRLRRHTALAMRAYPAIAAAEKFDTKERLAYLDKVFAMSSYSEEAWVEAARLAKAGALSDHKPWVASKQALALKTFSKWPDFIAAVNRYLLEVDPSPTAKVKALTPQVALFEKAHRPDLACDAVLKVAAALREQRKDKEAAKELARAVRKFPTEGRYIPRLLKAYEDLCADTPAHAPALAKLYIDLTPALVRHYKGESNKFLDAVIRQGVEFMERSSLPKQAAQLRALVAAAKG